MFKIKKLNSFLFSSLTQILQVKNIVESIKANLKSLAKSLASRILKVPKIWYCKDSAINILSPHPKFTCFAPLLIQKPYGAI